MVKLFANLFWIHTPEIFQKNFSKLFSRFFELRVSRMIILPYLMFFGLNSDDLDQFESDNNESRYSSYSDFFNRKLKKKLIAESQTIWPCEGYVCDWGTFSEKNNSIVKGQKMNLNVIFQSNPDSTKDYFFTNIFLHNHNYHRVHAPVEGVITGVQRIPGDLVFLRPWFFNRADVSYPAIRNERVVFEITDNEKNVWYMALVGGFGVGTIELSKHIQVGSSVGVGEEVARFNLGSTVCLATPQKIKIQNYLQTVRVGQKLEQEIS